MPCVALRPVVETDLEMLRRFAIDREVLGLDWSGFTDVGELGAGSTPMDTSATTEGSLSSLWMTSQSGRSPGSPYDTVEADIAGTLASQCCRNRGDVVSDGAPSGSSVTTCSPSH